VERLTVVEDAPLCGGDDDLDELLAALREYLPGLRVAISEGRIVKEPERIGRWLSALGDYLELLISRSPGGGAVLRVVPRADRPSP
jgi:hypothetical protein